MATAQHVYTRNLSTLAQIDVLDFSARSTAGEFNPWRVSVEKKQIEYGQLEERKKRKKKKSQL